MPLINSYNLYQRLMDYWNETMQDDCYLIYETGWQNSIQPREVKKIKNTNGKLVWPKESFDYLKGKKRFKSDLMPANFLIKKYFSNEQDTIDSLQRDLSSAEHDLKEMIEDNNGEEGYLFDVIEGEGEKQKITAKSIKDRLKEIDEDSNYEDECKILKNCNKLLEKIANIKNKLKTSQDELNTKIENKYPKIKNDEIKSLVIEDKWLYFFSTVAQDELDRVSEKLSERIGELAERYDKPLPELNKEIVKLTSKVDEHLKKMIKS